MERVERNRAKIAHSVQIGNSLEGKRLSEIYYGLKVNFNTRQGTFLSRSRSKKQEAGNRIVQLGLSFRGGLQPPLKLRAS